MTGWRSAAVGVVVLGCVALVVPAHAATEGPVPSRTLFSFDDPAVFESSGLVDIGPVVYTTNDSGDDAVLYGFDSGTGKLVSRTTYADEVEDVEALAPGRDGTVWAGDIGDNRQRRDSITAYAVTPRPGRQDRPAEAYELTYPDGPHNAEALLASPDDGRLYVVTKSPFGGTVYAAPRRLSADRPNALKAFARVARPGHRRRVPPGRQAGAAAHLRQRHGLHVPRLRAARHGAAPVAAPGRGHLGRAGRPGAGVHRGGAQPGPPAHAAARA